VTGAARLRRPPIGRLVPDRNVGQTRVGVRVLAAASGRLPAERLARLAGDATEALAELQAVSQPTPPVNVAGDDDQAAAS
jgi:hypothetical protein